MSAIFNTEFKSKDKETYQTKFININPDNQFEKSDPFNEEVSMKKLYSIEESMCRSKQNKVDFGIMVDIKETPKPKNIFVIHGMKDPEDAYKGKIN